MFDLDVDVWELVFRTVAVYIGLLALIRLSGKHTIGQFTPFDLLIVMLLSEGASNALNGGDDSLIGGLLICALLCLLNVAVATLSARSTRVEALLGGEAILIGRHGKIYYSVLERHHVSRNDMHQALREADCDLDEMRFAFLEADGSISVQKRRPREALETEPSL